jgi:hypothetical protein
MGLLDGSAGADGVWASVERLGIHFASISIDGHFAKWVKGGLVSAS